MFCNKPPDFHSKPNMFKFIAFKHGVSEVKGGVGGGCCRGVKMHLYSTPFFLRSIFALHSSQQFLFIFTQIVLKKSKK